jgi:ferrous iron transport protein B
VKPPERPDTVTGKIDDVLLNPAAGLLILAVLLFVMFQAVFTWAEPLMGLIEAAFTALSTGVGGLCPRACCAAC